jgi:hypothetical protein
MKKLFAAILALGLIIAVSGTASAVDVKLAGSYYIGGVYDNNPALRDDNSYSRAYMYQRLRLEPVFTVAPGLTFTSRMDALDGLFESANVGRSAAAFAADRNFSWERAYVTFTTGVGKFDVGYMSGGAWGTLWADNEGDRARIKYTTMFGNVVLLGIFEKNIENNDTARVDLDSTAYYLAPIYNFKGGSTGLLYGFIADKSARATGPNFNTVKKHILYPYLKGTFGSFYVEAELNYIFGKSENENAAVLGRDYKGYGAYLMAKTNIGPAAVGAQFGWSSGQDTAKTAANGGEITVGPGKGADWNPALILFNDTLNTWSGGDVNTGGNANLADGYMIVNLFADYKVTPKLAMGAGLTYAKADKAQIVNQDNAYGTEIDVTATYKLYDNLSYMVGAGYLFTGDWYKMGVANAKVGNDYILMNKLTLSF